MERKSSREREKPSRVRAAGLQLDTDDAGWCCKAAAVTPVCPSSWVTAAFVTVGPCPWPWSRPCGSAAPAICTGRKVKGRGPNLEHVEGTFLLLKTEYSYFL